ncbi:MAG: dTDP-4-dehydrorhamnose 3,5-epimerase family protein, partial [Calditrichia bacterium]|nr:dTDP-4-dehydrorhamnose 3,5-epimerase family protein [Calditrichia bacterium]
MDFKERKIDGVVIKQLKKFEDNRGWLMELFRHDDMDYREYPVMSYISETKPDVARGPHEHADQTDYFCFIGPSTFRLYLWD